MYTLELCSGICDDVDEDALTYPAEGHISFIADPHAVPCPIPRINTLLSGIPAIRPG